MAGELRFSGLSRRTLHSPTAAGEQGKLQVSGLARQTLHSPAAPGAAGKLQVSGLARQVLHSRPGAKTYPKKAKFTVQASKVTGASISNYVFFLTELTLPPLIFDSTHGARSDGGDIRAFSNSAAASEYPIDVVHFDKATSKALICVKLPSVSNSANTDFWLFWGDPNVTGYGANDPYGRWNVWTDYSFVALFNGTTLTADRTRNNRALTFAGSPTAVDGPYSKATRFNGTTGSVMAASTTVPLGAAITVTVVARRVGNGDANGKIVHAQQSGAGGVHLFMPTGTSDVLTASIYNGSGVATNFGSYALGSGWNEIALTSDTTGPLHKLFVNDVEQASNNAAIRGTTTTARVSGASNLTTTGSENAQVDLAMILIEPRIDADRQSTGKTNRNDPGIVTSTVISETVGSASGSGAAVAVGDFLTSGPTVTEAVGSAAGTATAAAIGRSTAEASAAASGTGSSGATGRAFAIATGAAAGLGLADAAGRAIAEAVGTSAGASSATALTGPAIVSAVGSAAGSGSAVATGFSLSSGAGIASGIGSGDALGVARSIAVGSASGTGLSAAVGRSRADAIGVAGGASSAPGTGVGIHAAVGSSSGAGVAAGTVRAIVGAVGTAAGAGAADALTFAITVSSAAGASSGAADGSAAGLAVSSAAGAAAGYASGVTVAVAIASAVGVAEGTCVVRGRAPFSQDNATARRRINTGEGSREGLEHAGDRIGEIVAGSRIGVVTGGRTGEVEGGNRIGNSPGGPRTGN